MTFRTSAVAVCCSSASADRGSRLHLVEEARRSRSRSRPDRRTSAEARSDGRENGRRLAAASRRRADRARRRASSARRARREAADLRPCARVFRVVGTSGICTMARKVIATRPMRCPAGSADAAFDRMRGKPELHPPTSAVRGWTTPSRRKHGPVGAAQAAALRRDQRSKTGCTSDAERLMR